MSRLARSQVSFLILWLAATLGSCVTAPIPATARSIPAETDGFQPLFDGKTMTGWRNAYDWGDITVVD